MLKPMLTKVLQHVMAQNSWAAEILMPFAGQSIRFEISPVAANLTVLENGSLAMSGESPSIDATVKIPFLIAMRMLANDDLASHQIEMSGNTELVVAVTKVLRNMSWEVEEDLSKVVGDVAAYQMANAARKTIVEVKTQSLNLAQMATEYWQEENPLIAKKIHLERFSQEVNTLREDVDRFDKRLEKLASLMKQSLIKQAPSGE